MDIVADRLIWRPPVPGLRMSIAIPACNEAADLPECLRALGQQTRCRPDQYEVVLLLNQCSDDSAAVARAVARQQPHLAVQILQADLPSHLRHVGGARRLAMDIACGRLDAAGCEGSVLATTDADTIVAPDWVAATLQEFAAGADLVAGDIMPDPGAMLPPDLARLLQLDRRHNLLKAELEALLAPDPRDPLPRHGHQTGASLALRAILYRLVGGLPPHPNNEDLALVAAIRQAGWAIRHSPLVRVETSVRFGGRARGGMADTLVRWQETLSRSDVVLAESAASIEQHLGGVASPDPSHLDIEQAVETIAARIETLRSVEAARSIHPGGRTPPRSTGGWSESPTSLE